MKLLVIAYEFPPSPSPQSLRWMYLVRELVALGHEVHVLTVDTPAGNVFLDDPQGVVVHRTCAGPVQRLQAWLARRNRSRQATTETGHIATGLVAAQPPSLNRLPQLNWKGKLVGHFRAFAEWAVFPDLRGEWKWSAKHRLRQLLDEISPDAVISSHEPATTLELGLSIRSNRTKWVADMADPVLAIYTPWRWRWRARHLEQATWDKADLLLVTNERAAELLARRYGRRKRDWMVIPQGFDDRLAPSSGIEGKEAPGLDLLYTGSFYSFRAPNELLRAVAMTPGVRLSIASRSLPSVVRDFVAEYPDRFRLLGFLEHSQVLKAQRTADILVDIANEDPSQIPGKFNEYLGAARPILHIAADCSEDLTAAFIERTGRGWVVENNGNRIAELLARLASQERRPYYGAVVRNEDVAAFGWSRIASTLADAIGK